MFPWLVYLLQSLSGRWYMDNDNFFRKRGIWYRIENRRIVSKIWRRIGELVVLYIIFFGFGLLIIMYILVKH